MDKTDCDGLNPPGWSGGLTTSAVVLRRWMRRGVSCWSDCSATDRPSRNMHWQHSYGTGELVWRVFFFIFEGLGRLQAVGICEAVCDIACQKGLKEITFDVWKGVSVTVNAVDLCPVHQACLQTRYAFSSATCPTHCSAATAECRSGYQTWPPACPPRPPSCAGD